MEISINYLAVFVAALSAFLIGGLWYSPILFGKAWMTENKFTEEFIKGGNSAKIFGGSFILCLVMAFSLAGFIPADEPWMAGLTAGALASISWVAMALGVLYLFERRSFKLFMINAGYFIVTFLLMGAIIGLWR